MLQFAKRALIIVVASSFVGYSLVGCNSAEGGKDPILDKKEGRDQKIQDKQSKAASDE